MSNTSKFKFHALIALGILSLISACKTGVNSDPPENPGNAYFDTLALTPPMGWNSYDNFDNTVTEKDVKDNADYIAENLRGYGWEYVVIDILWYMPLKGNNVADWDEILELDDYGRPLPSLDKFPSAAGGMGLKPIGDYIHSKGLKFGLHIMRGISREAVRKNLPVFGTSHTAGEIVNMTDTCSWYSESWGVNMIKPGSQEFYNSLFSLYADWGVDFIKADDMTSPHHPDEIEAVHKAILNCGRPMVLSLSPGPAFPGAAKNLQDYSNMWRISNDFWDNWKSLRHQFDLCHNWISSIKPGHWPDADMLPLGKVGTGMKKPRYTNFTPDEQYCMMSLWCIFRSPLMLGGNLPENDSLSVRLITNPEVIAVNQRSHNNREIALDKDHCIYAAQDDNSNDLYIALFNFSNSKVKVITADWKDLGIEGKFRVRDLWQRKDIGEFEGKFEAAINPHGGGLYRIKMN